jgi:hypothetical protein
MTELATLTFRELVFWFHEIPWLCLVK